MSDQKVLINGKPASAKSSIQWGDVITAAKPGNVEIILYPAMSLHLTDGTALKVLGSLIQKDAKNAVLTNTALQILKGQIQGQLLHDDGEQSSIRVIGRKSMSSIRGTVFEISADDDVKVFEGNVEVQDLKTNETHSVAADASLAKPELAKPEIIRSHWQSVAADVMASHAKEAAEYKKALDQSVQSSVHGLQNEAGKMFKGLDNPYGPLKKSK